MLGTPGIKYLLHWKQYIQFKGGTENLMVSYGPICQPFNHPQYLGLPASCRPKARRRVKIKRQLWTGEKCTQVKVKSPTWTRKGHGIPRKIEKGSNQSYCWKYIWIFVLNEFPLFIDKLLIWWDCLAELRAKDWSYPVIIFWWDRFKKHNSDSMMELTDNILNVHQNLG